MIRQSFVFNLLVLNKNLHLNKAIFQSGFVVFSQTLMCPVGMLFYSKIRFHDSLYLFQGVQLSAACPCEWQQSVTSFPHTIRNCLQSNCRCLCTVISVYAIWSEVRGVPACGKLAITIAAWRLTGER